MNCRRTISLGLVALMLTGLSGCCWIAFGICDRCGKCPDPYYGPVEEAARAAVHTLQGKYSRCFPANYSREAFFKDLEAQSDFGDANLGNLRLATVDVWTESDCTGYVLVAHRPGSHDIILWDKSSTTSSIDGKGIDGRPPTQNPPERKPPTMCSCNR
jgi:hypothetical protein